MHQLEHLSYEQLEQSKYPAVYENCWLTSFFQKNNVRRLIANLKYNWSGRRSGLFAWNLCYFSFFFQKKKLLKSLILCLQISSKTNVVCRCGLFAVSIMTDE